MRLQTQSYYKKSSFPENSEVSFWALLPHLYIRGRIFHYSARVERHKHGNGSTIDNGGDQMNANKSGGRIQDPISFDNLQSVGRVLTRAIRRAERRGDRG
jgi:hypothetical protein